MFRGEVGRRLFTACNEDGYLFDLHVLAVAENLGYRIAEVPVSWYEMPGSKLDLVRDSYGIARDLIRLRRSVGSAVAEMRRAGSQETFRSEALGRGPKGVPGPVGTGRKS
jgi:dolichyl-phosphate beta-glucosyltransferase